MIVMNKQQFAFSLGVVFIVVGVVGSMMQKTKPIIRKSLTAQTALIQAAKAHKINPALLLAISKIETAGTFSTSIRPRRKNGTYIGTARGLCQFIKRTAKAYKLDWATNDASKQAISCARLLNDNKKVLRAKLARAPTHGEIYLAHVFGAGRAVRIITAPNNRAVAATVGAKALKANRFLAKYKNAAGIRRWAERKINKAKFAVRIYLTDSPKFTASTKSNLWLNRSK